MKHLKLFLILISLSITIYPQMQHNFWYQTGPYGGEVRDISLSANSSEIAVVTEAGLSAFNFDWLDVADGSGISKVEYHPSLSFPLLLVTRNNQLLNTYDNGYHWHLVFTAQDSLTGLSISQVRPYFIFAWSDSTIYKGRIDTTSWDTIQPNLGKILTLYPHPIDSNIIYLGTSKGLYKSSNNGINWVSEQRLTKPINSIAISKGFPNIIYASNLIDNYIYVSGDNGVSWDSSNVGLPDSPFIPIRSVECSPDVNGMAFAATIDGVYKTVNTGAVWFKFSNQLSYLDSGIVKTLLTEIVKIKNNNVYAGTSEGLFETNVYTDLWQQIGPYNERVLSITKNIFSYDNQIIIGTPKGIKYLNYSSWNPSQLYSQSGPSITKLMSSHDYDNQFCLAASDNKSNKAIIYRSSDNGISWDTVYLMPNENCQVEYFYQRKDSSNIVFILVDNLNSSYGLYRSDQYGIQASWYPIESSYNKNFISAATDELNSTLYFLIDNNELYSSDDGGLNISYLSTIPGQRFTYIHFSSLQSVNTLYAAGDGVKRSLNFLTWENFGLDTIEVIELAEDWYSLFAATRYDGIYANYYYNGEWYPFNNGLATHEITDIVNLTHAIMHVATANNSVYIVYSIINEASEEILMKPNDLILYQNYPNPFNPTTKITWQSPVSGLQILKMYDVLGNEVATLVNEYKPAGSYSVEFSDRNLSSGVYFYQLSVSAWPNQEGKGGSFVETKKMILLR